MRGFGWSYEYLLWGISWLNLQLMIADAPRTKETPTDEEGNPIEEGEVIEQELTTKEDIKNYLKGYL